MYNDIIQNLNNSNSSNKFISIEDAVIRVNNQSDITNQIKPMTSRDHVKQSNSHLSEQKLSDHPPQPAQQEHGLFNLAFYQRKIVESCVASLGRARTIRRLFFIICY